MNQRKRPFVPSFINRLDEMIVFRNLEKEDIVKIIDVEMRHIAKNMIDNKLVLTLDDEAKNFIAEKGFDPKFGARPLRRAIQQYIEDPLSEEILRGSFKDGAKIVASRRKDEDFLIFLDENALEKIVP